MIARSTLFTVSGGDTVQVTETAKALRLQGTHVDVRLSNETVDYAGYDLLHFFNITRPADILFHVRNSGKPFVISTILIDYSGYDKHHRKGIAGTIFHLLSADSIEYVKTIARWLAGKDKMVSLEYLLKGQRRSIKEILTKAAALLPNSESEYRRLQLAYRCKKNYVVIPNGIDTNLFKNENNEERDPTLVICVARIEGIKNQLNVIKALSNTRYQLLLIGAAAPNQISYYNECKAAAADNINFIGPVPQKDLLQYYRKAKVHVLASWFETTGLSTLEAAAMGCNIVITDKGDAKEYFGDDAVYCDPSSPQSIYGAIEKAASLSSPVALQQKITRQFNWQKAAIDTSKEYQKITHRS
jgi:glycosyltransferase involved in cell wall biosynthesis